MNPESRLKCLISPPHYSASRSRPRLFKDKAAPLLPVSLWGHLSLGLQGQQTKTVDLFEAGGHAWSKDPNARTSGIVRFGLKRVRVSVARWAMSCAYVAVVNLGAVGLEV